MNNMNDAIRAAIGQPGIGAGDSNSAQDARASRNTVALRNIVTNGTLLNQNVSKLIQALNTLKASWGG